MKVAINYADEGFRKQQAYNTKTAYQKGKFDKILEYSPEDIDAYFWKDNEEILTQSRGGGYWLWKPYIIKKTLEKLEYGDYLFYCDSGTYYIRSIDYLISYIEDVIQQDIMVYELPLIEKQWTKRDAFILMDCDSEVYANTNQRLASFFLMKKTDNSVKFIEEFLEYCRDERILTDKQNCLDKKNYNGFIEHRHDQSIFSLLSKKHNIVACKDPSQFGLRPYEYYRKNRIYNYKNYSQCLYPQIIVQYRHSSNIFIVKIKEIIKKLFERFYKKYFYNKYFLKGYN